MDNFIYVGDVDTLKKLEQLGYTKMYSIQDNSEGYIAVFLNNSDIRMSFASAGIDEHKVHYSNMLYF